jgi:hypothetical protein
MANATAGNAEVLTPYGLAKAGPAQDHCPAAGTFFDSI